MRERRRGRWVAFSFHQPVDLPNVPTCYVIKFGSEVAYVGQTRSLRQRFIEHGIRRAEDPNSTEDCWVTPWGIFKKRQLTFKRRISENYGDWLMHEARLVRRLQPLWNQQGVT